MVRCCPRSNNPGLHSSIFFSRDEMEEPVIDSFHDNFSLHVAYGRIYHSMYCNLHDL